MITYEFNDRDSYKKLLKALALDNKLIKGAVAVGYFGNPHLAKLYAEHILLHHEEGLTAVINYYQSSNLKPSVLIAGGDEESHKHLNSELERLTGDKLTKK